MSEKRIAQIMSESIAVKEDTLANQGAIIYQISQCVLDALRNNGKILLFGNGGSAADAQHITCELVGRFKREREGLPAIALTTDTSVLTSVGNDYGFETIFARQVEALGRSGDVAIGISTTGNSVNVVRGIEIARQKGLSTVGFTGGSGGELAQLCNLCLIVPSANVPRVQEVHITVGHIICELVEEGLSHCE